jgi:hypothetical protein
MKKVLISAAVVEGAAGLAMLIAPSLVGQLLFGKELSGAAIPVARVTGIAWIGLAIACWPDLPEITGMLFYDILATLYLAYLGFAGEFVGVFLWPVIVVHAVLSILLGRAWLAAKA